MKHPFIPSTLMAHHAPCTTQLFILICFILPALSAYAQPVPEKKTIATLGPGETIAYGESCFRLDLPSETFSFVTMTGSGDSKQYFCYGPDGKKTGPVAKPDPSYWSGNKDIPEEKCNASDPGDMTGMSGMIDFSDGSITFQGKKFGPYGQVILFNQPSSLAGFCAIGIGSDMKITAFDNNGRKIVINGMPEEIIVSPDGKNAVVKVNGSKSPFEADYFQYMMDHPDEADNPKVFLFTMDGKKYGPYDSGSFRDTWYTDAGQWIVYAASELFVNGASIGKVGESVAACDIWIAPDGKRFAWANYEKLAFSDGTTLQAPVVMRGVNENGQLVLKWLTLENGKDLVFYTKSF